MKRISFVGLMMVVILALTGCKHYASPSVTSKNDGSFDKSVIVSRNSDDTLVNVSENVEYITEFDSTDGSVHFLVDIDTEINSKCYSVVEVTPHYITEEDAKRVATVLLGNVDFYEQEPWFAPQYTKAQILEKINRWSNYTNVQAIKTLYGDKGNAERSVEVIKQTIEEYTNAYENASESEKPQLCEWKFKKDSFYLYAPDEIVVEAVQDENDAIKAFTQKDGIEYTFAVSVRNKNDFKINNIHLNLATGISPDGIDRKIYRAMLCRTSVPTEKVITEVKNKAQSMLDGMKLGQWKIDKAYVDTMYFGDVAEYIINISAVPVINENPVIRRQQLNNLKSTTSYASNYYLTDAIFQFSANGKLVSFDLYSPTDEKEILSNNVVTKTIDELMDLALNHLSLSDYYEYGLGVDFLNSLRESLDEDLECLIDVCQFEFGMLRVKAPNTDDSYYYVPGVLLSGTIDYVGKKSGEVYAASGEMIYSSRVVPLVAINAVDGSIIELNNE